MTNTGIPPLIPTLNRLSDRLTSIEGLFNRNATSFGRLLTNIQNFGDVIGGFASSFNKRDNLQIRSLAIGTDLNKFLKTNEKTLNNMRGDFFENAEELLKNFAFGIRDNTDITTGLMTRMKQTGQSTDVLRQFIGDMTLVTGGSIQSIDNLSKSTEDLGIQYGVTQQSLMEAVLALRDATDSAGLMGIGEEFARIPIALQGIVKDIGGPQLTRTLNFLADSNNLGTKAMLGVPDALARLTEEGLSDKEIQGRFKDIVNTMNENGNRIFGMQNKSIGADLRLTAVTGNGLKDILANSQQLGVALQQGLEANRATRDTNAKFAESAKTVNQEAMRFYQKTLESGGVYDTILNTLPILRMAAIGQGVASLAAGGRELLGVAGLGRMLTPVVRLAGPIGIIAGTIMAFAPHLMSTGDKSLNELKDINSKTPERPKEERKPKTIDDFMLDMMSKSIGLSSSKSSGLVNVNEAQLKLLEKIHDGIDKLNKQNMVGRFNKGGG